MGIQTNIKLRGTVENVIYYQWNGIHCMRSVPQKVRQTRNTKKAASVFGMAVRNAAAMRAMLRPVLPDPASRPMIYDVDRAFREWLQTGPLQANERQDKLPSFDNLSFNKDSYPGKAFNAVTVTRHGESDLLIRLPALRTGADVTAPAGTVRLGITFMAATLPFNDEMEQQVLAADTFMPYTESKSEPKEILLSGVTGLHCLTLVVMSMRFYKSNNESLPVDQKRWKQAVIVGSFYN